MELLRWSRKRMRVFIFDYYSTVRTKSFFLSLLTTKNISCSTNWMNHSYLAQLLAWLTLRDIWDLLSVCVELAYLQSRTEAVGAAALLEDWDTYVADRRKTFYVAIHVEHAMPRSSIVRKRCCGCRTSWWLLLLVLQSIPLCGKYLDVAASCSNGHHLVFPVIQTSFYDCMWANQSTMHVNFLSVSKSPFNQFSFVSVRYKSHKY